MTMPAGKGPGELALKAMEIGECRRFKEDLAENPGRLAEIHRVFGGWIYVFREYCRGRSDSSTLTSTFVPEETAVVTRKLYDNVPG